MENPVEVLKDWAASEIEKAKLEAQIGALTCVRDAVDGKLNDLRSQRDGPQTVRLREPAK